jgi:hypothetical protein
MKFRPDDPMILDIINYIENFANENDLQVCDYSHTASFISSKVRGMIEILEHLTGEDIYLAFDRQEDEWEIRFEEDFK